MDIRLTLEIPERVEAGSFVPFRMRIENTSAEPVELYLRGREITCDFVVRGPGGAIVWRRLEGDVTLAILRLEVLRSGQAIEVGDSWDQRDNSGELVQPGAYSVTGSVLTDGSARLESDAVAFRIERK